LIQNLVEFRSIRPECSWRNKYKVVVSLWDDTTIYASCELLELLAAFVKFCGYGVLSSIVSMIHPTIGLENAQYVQYVLATPNKSQKTTN